MPVSLPVRLGLAVLALGVGIGGVLVVRSSLPPAAVPTDTALGTKKNYVSFVINTQEFIYDDLSAETLNRIIDIHERYGIPVDVYLDDAIAQKYETNAPELLERLKTSDVVAVSYHIRPPKPYYSGFDWAGLDEMAADDLLDLLTEYETHAVDPTTAEPTDAPGGYGHLSELMGYAPVVAAMQPNPESGPALARLFREMGASFFIEHRAEPIELGEKKSGVYLRPETEEVRLFARTDETAEEIVAGTFANADAVDGPTFVNVKVHDNDFIADASAWTSIYIAKGTHRRPPFDLTLGTTNRSLLSDEESETLWSSYEASVAYVAEHSDLYTAVNAFGLLEIVGE